MHTKKLMAVKKEMNTRQLDSCHLSLNLAMGTRMKMTTMLQIWLKTFRLAYCVEVKPSKT